MKRISIKVILTLFLSILFFGCAKNEPIVKMDMNFNKKIKVGIISHVGNTLEYGYSANTLLMETKYLYTQINEWNIDRFIEKKFINYLEKKGFTNVNIVYPTEKLVSLKNEIKTYYYPNHILELSKIANEDDLDLIFYIENFVVPEENRLVIEDKGSYWMRNIFVYADKSFLTGEIKESVFIPLMVRAIHFTGKDKLKFNYSNKYIVHSENLDEIQSVTKNGTYDRTKIDKLEPIIKDHLSEIINEYFKEKGI